MKLLIFILLLFQGISFAQTSDQVTERLMWKCDSQMINRLGEENCKKHVSPNSEQSFILCADSNKYSFIVEPIDCEIRSITIAYNIIQDGDTIHTIEITSDIDGNVDCLENHDWRWDLEGYKSLLEGKFPINYKRAAEIVKENGYNAKEFELHMEHAYENMEGLKSFEWQGNKFVDNKTTKAIYVNAFTGKFKEVLIKEVEFIFVGNK